MQISEPLQLVTAKLSGWLEGLIASLPNLVVAILILVAGWLVAKGVRRLARKALARSLDNPELARIGATVAGVAVFLAFGFIALGVLNLDKTVTTLLAGAGVIGLALGFAFQDAAANFVSGLVLAIRRPFQEGDLVELDGELAKVERIELRSTIVRRLDGPIVHIPNSTVFRNAIVNYTEGGARRVDVEVGVSYADDLDQARSLALEAVGSLDVRDEHREPEFYWNEFGGSSINGVARFWVDNEARPVYLEARSRAIVAIKRAFDDADITIPFPIRTLDFGIEGGEKLADALPWERLSRGGSPASTGNHSSQ